MVGGALSACWISTRSDAAHLRHTRPPLQHEASAALKEKHQTSKLNKNWSAHLCPNPLFTIGSWYFMSEYRAFKASPKILSPKSFPRTQGRGGSAQRLDQTAWAFEAQERVALQALHRMGVCSAGLDLHGHGRCVGSGSRGRGQCLRERVGVALQEVLPCLGVGRRDRCQTA